MLVQLAAYQATALSVRDQLLKRWNDTTTYVGIDSKRSSARLTSCCSYHTARAPKRIYYLSIEWLLGRSLDNAVLNLGMRNTYEDASRKLGFVSLRVVGLG